MESHPLGRQKKRHIAPSRLWAFHRKDGDWNHTLGRQKNGISLRPDFGVAPKGWRLEPHPGRAKTRHMALSRCCIIQIVGIREVNGQLTMYHNIRFTAGTPRPPVQKKVNLQKETPHYIILLRAQSFNPYRLSISSASRFLAFLFFFLPALAASSSSLCSLTRASLVIRATFLFDPIAFFQQASSD